MAWGIESPTFRLGVRLRKKKSDTLTTPLQRAPYLVTKWQQSGHKVGRGHSMIGDLVGHVGSNPSKCFVLEYFMLLLDCATLIIKSVTKVIIATQGIMSLIPRSKSKGLFFYIPVAML